MCWAVPAKVIEIHDIIAKVDFGGGNIKEVLIGIDEAELRPGDYVLVHAGLIISKIKPEQIIEQLRMYRETYLEYAKESGIDVSKIVEEIDKEISEWLKKAGMSEGERKEI